MATYKGIQGYSVQKLTTDPTAADTAGQLWYNSTSGAFKISTEGAGTWASANAIPANRSKAGGCGITTAGLYVGGSEPTPTLNNALEFDGTDWTIGGTMNQPSIYSTFTAGTQIAAVASGGYSESPAGNKTTTEEYNGSAWATGNAMVGTARDGGGAAGIQTAAIAFAGNQTGTKKLVEDYDGTCWTAGTALTSDHGRCMGAQSGTNTATLCIGGDNAGLVEDWNGSAWTEVNNINTSRQFGGGGGTSAAAFIVGGYNPSPPYAKYANTETYDGTSWSEGGDISAAKAYVYAFGTASSGVIGGGVTGPSSTSNSVTAEVWTNPVYTIKTVTVS